MKSGGAASSDVFVLMPLPCSVNKVVRVWPVWEQVGSFHVVDSDVHVGKGFWEKVVNFPRHIQYVADTEKHTESNLLW